MVAFLTLPGDQRALANLGLPRASSGLARDLAFTIRQTDLDPTDLDRVAAQREQALPTRRDRRGRTWCRAQPAAATQRDGRQGALPSRAGEKAARRGQQRDTDDRHPSQDQKPAPLQEGGRKAEHSSVRAPVDADFCVNDASNRPLVTTGARPGMASEPVADDESRYRRAATAGLLVPQDLFMLGEVPDPAWRLRGASRRAAQRTAKAELAREYWHARSASQNMPMGPVASRGRAGLKGSSLARPAGGSYSAALAFQKERCRSRQRRRGRRELTAPRRARRPLSSAAVGRG